MSMTWCPELSFNLAIFGKFRQIAKFPHYMVLFNIIIADMLLVILARYNV